MPEVREHHDSEARFLGELAQKKGVEAPEKADDQSSDGNHDDPSSDGNHKDASSDDDDDKREKDMELLPA